MDKEFLDTGDFGELVKYWSKINKAKVMILKREEKPIKENEYEVCLIENPFIKINNLPRDCIKWTP